MRDTQRYRDARAAEVDPYARKFTFPKWTRLVTVLDEPRIFRRLPEFGDWTRARHAQVATDYLMVAHADRLIWADIIRRYEGLYGDHGALISGGHRDHWPSHAKDACRYFARRVTDFTSKSAAHWQAAGKRMHTWRALNSIARWEAPVQTQEAPANGR